MTASGQIPPVPIISVTVGPAPTSRVERRPPWATLVPALLMVAGTITAVVAVVQASAAVLAVAGLLLLAGIGVTTVVARQRVQQSRRRVAVIAATVALAALVLVPASLNVDPCTRTGRDADLSGCDLSGQNLADEDLRGADLGGADLSGANLTRADLVGADLDGASLHDANLSAARLDEATATGADLRDADLGGAALSGADLTGADARGARGPEAELTGAVLAEADLTGGDLSGATLVGADLAGTDLTEAVLDSAELSDAVLSGTTLASSDLSGATLARADLTGADLSGADLTGVSARDATFEEAELTDARLRSNQFVGATGITDEGLAAALGVPGPELPAETRLRGIVFDPYDDILDALTPVRDGQEVPEARAYEDTAAFHPAIVLDADGLGRASWLADVHDLWAPTGIRYAELVVVVLPEGQESIQTCTGYVFDDGTPAPSINRYVRTVTVRVLSAQDAQTVAERTFRGSDPRPCRDSEFLPSNDPALYGDPPDLNATAQPWLADLVNPPAEQSA